MSPVLPDVVMSYLDCDSGSARRAAIIAFLAQGWHLALFDDPLFAGKIYACPDGQIQIAAHHAYEEESACPSSMLATRSTELLDMLCAHYRKLSQAELQAFVATEICLIEPVFAPVSASQPLFGDSLREITEQPLKARFMAKLEAGQALFTAAPVPKIEMLDILPASRL
ncbi:MAG: hypothetical protein ACPHO2_00035 [Candidatus Puniceispirillaceae bacterium]